MHGRVLLDPGTTPVELLSGQANNMERVYHDPRIGELLGRGALVAGEPVHRHHLHPIGETADPARPFTS
jgi:hypothetical protein